LRKPCAFRDQSLREHTEGCLRVFEAFAEKNKDYFEVVSRRLNAALEMGGRVKPEGVEEMAGLAILFHDVGKAYNHFQRWFDDSCACRKDKVAFQYHEVASAAMCYKFAEKHGWEREEKALTVLSVLNHHHASRNPFREAFTGDEYIEKKVHKIVGSGFCEGDLPELFKTCGVHLSELVLNSSDVSGFFSWLGGGLRKHSWLKLYILVMYPLIIADNLDAEQRGGIMSKSRKMFVRELKEVVGC